MNLLQAVNKVITRLGENPVTSVDAKHPTVSLALQHIHSVNAEFQLTSWWFNSGQVTLKPSSDGRIYVPEDTLIWFTPHDNTHLEGSMVVNTDTLEDVWDRELQGTITREIDFEDVPRSFSEWVAAEASVRAYMADFGADDMLQIWQGDVFRLGQLVQKEHLKNKKHNVRNRRIARRLYRSIWK